MSDPRFAVMKLLPHASDVGNVEVHRASEAAFAAVMRSREVGVLAALIEQTVKGPCVLECQRVANLISIYIQTGKLPRVANMEHRDEESSATIIQFQPARRGPSTPVSPDNDGPQVA